MVIESSCCYVSLLYLQLNPCASVLSTYPMFPGEYAPCVAVENDDIKVRTSIESTSQSFELTSYRQIRLLSSPVPSFLHSRLSKLLVMNVPQAYRLCLALFHRYSHWARCSEFISCVQGARNVAVNQVNFITILGNLLVGFKRQIPGLIVNLLSSLNSLTAVRSPSNFLTRPCPCVPLLTTGGRRVSRRFVVFCPDFHSSHSPGILLRC